MNALAVLLICLPAVAFGINCTGQADGNYEIGCRTYVVCASGQAQPVACEKNTAYNKDTGKCEDITKIPPPCGVMKDCSSSADGRYPDLDNACKSYYTCVSGTFVGHNFCPGDLVFDEVKQICSWKNLVSAPCGTA